MKQTPSFDFTHSWSAEQVLAAYDFCYRMSEALWDEHEDILLEQMRQETQECQYPLSAGEEERNLELPFDDDIPF